MSKEDRIAECVPGVDDDPRIALTAEDMKALKHFWQIQSFDDRFPVYRNRFGDKQFIQGLEVQMAVEQHLLHGKESEKQRW